MPSRTEDMQKLTTVKEVAEALGLGESSVYRMAKTGRIPAVVIGRRVRFEPASIEAWLRTHRTGADIARSDGEADA